MGEGVVGSKPAARPSAEEIAELRAQGYGWGRVSKLTGVPESTLRSIVDPAFAEKQRLASREAKRRRHGVCERCGAVTNYNGHGRALSRYCGPCGADVSREAAIAKRGSGSLNAQVLDILADGREHRYTEICTALGKPNSSRLFIRLIGYGLIERTRRGYYRRVATPLAQAAVALTEVGAAVTEYQALADSIIESEFGTDEAAALSSRWARYVAASARLEKALSMLVPGLEGGDGQ